MSGKNASESDVPSSSAFATASSVLAPGMKIGGQSSSKGGNTPPSLKGLLPFDYDVNASATTLDIPSESKMTPVEAKKALSRMYEEWGVTDSAVKTLLFDAVILYLIQNGASRRGEYKSPLVVAGVEYPSRVIHKVLDSKVRKFARVYANYARELLGRYEDVAKAQAKAAGVSTEHATLCFDFSDKCSDLTEEELHVVAAVRNMALRSSTPIETVDRTVKSVIGTSTGPGWMSRTSHAAQREFEE